MWCDESYREFCVAYLSSSKINIEGKHNYQFGICSGIMLRLIYEMFQYYHLIPEKIHAFDSFEGIPKEQDGIPCLARHVKGACSVKDFENF